MFILFNLSSTNFKYGCIIFDKHTWYTYWLEGYFAEGSCQNISFMLWHISLSSWNYNHKNLVLFQIFGATKSERATIWKSYVSISFMSWLPTRQFRQTDISVFIRELILKVIFVFRSLHQLIFYTWHASLCTNFFFVISIALYDFA